MFWLKIKRYSINLCNKTCGTTRFRLEGFDSNLHIDAEFAALRDTFPEATILLVSDRDRDLWDNPFADNKILVVVPTAQARTNKSNMKQETEIFMRRFSFLSAN